MNQDMEKIEKMYQLIMEINKLKLVFRNTITNPQRNESTAEHSWSASMITLILMNELKREFKGVDELKIIKLVLIHDVVEIYAGDVLAFDLKARKDKEKVELEALEKLSAVYPSFGIELDGLWHEFEERKSLEAKIAKAADAICPIFQRLQAKQSYIPFDISMAQLEKTKYPYFQFSKTFSNLFEKLKADLLKAQLILL